MLILPFLMKGPEGCGPCGQPPSVVLLLRFMIHCELYLYRNGQQLS